MKSLLSVRRQSLRVLLVLSGLLPVCGCGESNQAMPPPSNPEVARQALEKALSHWQSGQTVDALASATPQMYVNDFDWRDGRKLKQFQLAGPPEEVGLAVRLPVALDVENGLGQVIRSQVSYSVSTTPVVSIVRDDP